MAEVLDTKTANKLATGAPGPIILDGQTYLVAQPKRGDYVTFQKLLAKLWKQKNANPVAAGAEALAALPEKLQQFMVANGAVQAAMALPSQQEPSKENLVAMSMEPEAVAFLTWILIRQNHPAVALEVITAAVKKAEAAGTLDDVIADVLQANGLLQADPNSAGATGTK